MLWPSALAMHGCEPQRLPLFGGFSESYLQANTRLAMTVIICNWSDNTKRILWGIRLGIRLQITNRNLVSCLESVIAALCANMLAGNQLPTGVRELVSNLHRTITKACVLDQRLRCNTTNCLRSRTSQCRRVINKTIEHAHGYHCIEPRALQSSTAREFDFRLGKIICREEFGDEMNQRQHSAKAAYQLSGRFVSYLW